MIIKNLQLQYQGQQDGKAILRSENGAEIWLDDFLLTNLENREQPLYLAMDSEPLVSSAEDKKTILNELLNPEDDK